MAKPATVIEAKAKLEAAKAEVKEAKRHYHRTHPIVLHHRQLVDEAREDAIDLMLAQWGEQ